MLKLSRTIIPILLLGTLLLSGLASAITIAPGFVWQTNNTRYGVSASIDFNNWTLGSTWLRLNGLGLNFSSVRATWINFSSFNSAPKYTSPGQIVFNFTTNATNRWSTFNVSGLKNSYSYILINGSFGLPLGGGTLQSITTSSAGQLQWKHNLTVAHTFLLYDGYIPGGITVTISPTDHSTGVPIHPQCIITATEPSGTLLTIRFYDNAMILRQTNSSIISGSTVRWTYTQATDYSTLYHWTIRINTSTTPKVWYNNTYSFTTLPSYDSPGETNIVGIAIPAVIAVTLIVMLFAMLYAGALTVETFVTWLILFIIAMIAIFVIFGISI